jgi:metal transporter CNNM
MQANVAIWIGMALCVAQAALLSGINLAVFSIGRLRLDVDAADGNRNAIRLLGLRRDSILILPTILWGVATNVLLTLPSGSLLTGVAAFVFSIIVITFVGEIIPQAYFSHLRRFAQGRGSGTRWPKEIAVAVIQLAPTAPGFSSGSRAG